MKTNVIHHKAKMIDKKKLLACLVIRVILVISNTQVLIYCFSMLPNFSLNGKVSCN